MKVVAASEPGSKEKPNEDHFAIGPEFAIVTDGATARTETGCIHGVPWYAMQLGSSIQRRLPSAKSLSTALRGAIADVAAMHIDTCDLLHSGTPSAAIGLIRQSGKSFEWLVLGDITVAIKAGGQIEIFTDPHNHVAADEQAKADQYPIGDPRKIDAMQEMKRTELAARNIEGGFWVAAAEPAVVEHAIIGSIPVETIEQVGLFTDGAARIVELFEASTWPEVLKALSTHGPDQLLQHVRTLEANDPDGRKWPRNKRSDDATALSCKFMHLWNGIGAYQRFRQAKLRPRRKTTMSVVY